MSQNHPTDNIYNILDTLKALEPTPAETVKAQAQHIRESVESQGSILKGLREVSTTEQRLAKMFEESNFDKTTKAIEKSGNSEKSAKAIAATIGREKLGQAEMTRRSVAGRKKANEAMDEAIEECAMCEAGTCTEHTDQDAVNENGLQQLSIEQLATISDTALDSAYGYGRSQPGNTFGWQANLKSAAFAKQMIDKGVADIEAISDAIHKGWNVTAQAFVKNPQMFDDSKTMAPEKLQAKIAQRQKLMTQQYAQLPEDEKEKDRVVARAMLQAITGGQQEVGEDMEPEDLGTVAEINRLIAKGMHETDAIHVVAKKWGDNPSELASFYYQHNRMHEGTVHKGTYGTSYDPSDEEKRDKPKREIKHGQKGRPRAEKPMDSKSAPKGDIFGRTTGEVPKGKRGTKIKGKGNIDESTSYQKQNFIVESFNFANMMKETDQTVQEMLTELQSDIANFKMTGECSPKLDAFLRVHGHSKKQLADEAKTVPNYEVPAVQRKAAGEPPLSLSDVHTHDTHRSMHPGMTKLDAPKPAHHHIHDELDELAQLAGITDEGNAFTGKLAKTAHGDSFDLDGKTYKDTSQLDEETCNECGMYESQCSCTEGNLFTKKLAQTPKGSEFELDGKQYKDTSNLDEASLKLEDIAKLAGIAVEGKDYGDASFNEAPTYDNTPDEQVQGEDVLLKGGDGEVAGAEKKMAKDGAARFSDNPLAMKESETKAADLMKEAATFDPIEAMGRKLMKQYESIKLQK